MATVTQTDADQVSATTTNYNFTLDIGADGGNDMLYVAVGARATNGVTLPTSLTLDGVAAVSVANVKATNGSTRNGVSEIFVLPRNSLPDPAQTNVDASWTLAVNGLRAFIAIFVAPNGGQIAFDTATDFIDGNEAVPSTLDLDVDTPAGGIGIGTAQSGGGGIGESDFYDWTGLTEQTDTTVPGVGGAVFTTALASNVSAETPRNISVEANSPLANNSDATSVAVSFKPRASVSYLSTFTSTTNAASYTDTARSIGANHGDDVLYFFAAARFTTTIEAGNTLATVDGISADLVGFIDTGTATGNAIALFAINRNDLPDPDQTDVDVVVTWDNSALNTTISYYISPDATKTATAVATDFDAAAVPAGVAHDLDVNTEADGIVIAFSFCGNVAAPTVPCATWTGLTEDSDQAGPENTFNTAAHADGTTAETPRNIALAYSTGADNVSPVSIAASFPSGPAEETITCDGDLVAQAAQIDSTVAVNQSAAAILTTQASQIDSTAAVNQAVVASLTAQAAQVDSTASVNQSFAGALTADDASLSASADTGTAEAETAPLTGRAAMSIIELKRLRAHYVEVSRAAGRASSRRSRLLITDRQRCRDQIRAIDIELRSRQRKPRRALRTFEEPFFPTARAGEPSEEDES